MHGILRNLRSGAIVLDLGSGGKGSVDSESYPGVRMIRLDNEFPKFAIGDGFVQGDGARLPFGDGVFDAVIANHSLEHIDDLGGALKEIGRVVRPGGSLYVAVPDASTLTDRIYRWIFHGGGHVNGFRSAVELEVRIAGATGMKPVARRVLHTSLIFLGRHHFEARPPRKLWLFANGDLRFIACLTYMLRLVDRWFGTRSSVYGWAFYFGEIREEIATEAWTNVCVKCGTGQSSACLTVNGEVRRAFLGIHYYHCTVCGTWNLFTEDPQ